MSGEVKERFLSKVLGTDRNGCHIWGGYLYTGGYGKLRVGKKKLGAHRVSYELFKGSINGFDVLHKCDTPSCVNPEHLFLGTDKDNAADRTAKKRGHNERKTKCHKGHPLSGSNLILRKNNTRRVCRECVNTKMREWNFKNRDKMSVARRLSYKLKKEVKSGKHSED